MSRLILRPLFVFLTLAVIVLAFFQVAGRLMFVVLDQLEVGINQWLSPQQIVVSGLEGDWRRVNPIVRIEEIRLPAGHLKELEVEVDWLESLIRNRLVARSVNLAGGRLALERVDGGWRLKGALAGAGEFNPFSTLYHSDQIAVALDLAFLEASPAQDVVAAAAETLPANQAPSAELPGGHGTDLRIDYRATNRGGEHRHRLRLKNADCAKACTLEFAIDEQEPIFLLRQRQLSAELSGGGLRLPEALVAGEGGTVDSVSGGWWLDGDRSGGRARARFSGLRIDDDVLEGRLQLAARGSATVHHLKLETLVLASDEQSWTLPPFFATLAPRTDALGLETGSELRLWTERIDAGPGFRFLTALAPRESAVFRWLNALQVNATAVNVHAFGRFPGLETGLLATVRDIEIDGYNGAPWIRNAAGELLAANNIMQLTMNSEALGLQFPDMFRQRWTMDHLSGHLQAYISADYFALRGANLRAEFGSSHASAGFALTRPRDARYRERLSLLINVDETTVSRGKSYIPYRLPAGLPEWLEDGPRSGDLHDVAFAYHGQIHTRPDELARRVAFAARIDAGHIQYHPDWPEVTDLSGRIGVEGRDVRITVDEGTSLDSANLAGSRIRLVDNATYADIDLRSETNVDESLRFIRSTPLADWMPFVTPDWSGSGPLSMSGRLKVPLKLGGEGPGGEGPGGVGPGGEEPGGEEPDREELGIETAGADTTAEGLEVDLDIILAGADLELPDFGVELGTLEGELHYTYPYAVDGSGVRGLIFDRPAIFGASSDEDTVIFHVDGQAPYEAVLELLEVRDPGGIRGGFDFIADLHIELGDAASRLDVVSDLTGLALDLPGEFAKAPEDLVTTELVLHFLDEYQSARFRYGIAQGWLHVDETPLRGAIGFAGPPPLIDGTGDSLVLGGRINGFTIEEVVPDGEGGPSLSLPLLLEDLEVGTIDIGGVPFNEAVLNGRIGAGDETDLDLSIDSPDLVGTLVALGDEPLQLKLELLRLPESEAEEGEDPLDASVVAELTDADLELERFEVGALDYGAWRFRLRPEDGGVALYDLEATLRGVEIRSERLYWDALENQSYFAGSLEAGDLAEVLPLWDYAASVSTERAGMRGELNWRGSPAMIDLDRIIGRADFDAENGRFLEVTQGADAMKIFSLVNFSTIAKRLNFDFSDVVGEGVSFDTLTASTEFNEGTMRFLEPMAVEGSGSNFRIGGQVDLVEGRLDNEMIVTLPVTKGLPWYAAYVALANPLAGLGVRVGERVLRKPLEQFSSAKYEISGTFEDPELRFVSVWDTSMDAPQVSFEAIELEGEDGEPAAEETPPAPAEGGEEQTALNTETTD
ncbi:MAG: AsmA-like C-terminal region-containing protein [Pseudomonadota bacterium]